MSASPLRARILVRPRRPIALVVALLLAITVVPGGVVEPAPAAAQSVVFSDGFGLVDGSAWDSGLWTTSTFSDGVVDVQSAEGHLAFVSGGGANAKGIAVMPATTDAEVLMSFRYSETTTAARFAVWLRASGDWTAASAIEPNDGYGLVFTNNSDGVFIQERNSGSPTNLTSSIAAAEVTTSTQWLRFRVEGDQLQARVWTDGQTEPSTWEITATDSTITAGGVLQAGFRRVTGTAQRDLYVDDVEVTDLNGSGGGSNGSIGDLVFHDVDGNGVFDAGESGLAGVDVDLFDVASTLVGSVTTAADGSYSFTGLAAGDYTVDVDETTLPAGYVLTTTNEPLSLTLGVDEAYDTADFGYYDPNAPTGSIGDVVFDDADADGVFDAGESGLAGVDVDLFDVASTLVGSVTTAADGSYSFTGLAAGDYTVDVDETTLPAGYVLTTTNEPATITVLEDAAYSGANFGYTSNTGGSGGVVFSDGFGLVDGSAWDSGLWTTSTFSDGVVDVQSAEGHLAFVSGGGANAKGIAVMPATTDAEVLMSFRYSETTTAARFAVWLRASGDWTAASAIEPNDGYGLVFTNNSDGVFIQERNSGSPTNLTSSIAAAEVTTSTQWLRFRVEGDQLQARVWTDGQTEPSTWEITATDSTITAGGVLQAGFRRVTGTAQRDLYVDDVEVTDLNGSGGGSNGSIGDLVFHDVDGNGVFDAGESGLAGVDVDLFDVASTLVGSVTTAADGSYSFTGLAAGDYTVDVDETTLPAGYVLTTTNEPASVNLLDGLAYGGAVFGYRAVSNGPFGSIGDVVFDDADADGVFDAGESGLAGVDVDLFDVASTLVGSVTTAADGSYSFTGLAAGDYTVDVDEATLPAGYVLTTTNEPLAVTLGVDEAYDTADFGFVPGASITVTVFDDIDASGVQDGTEDGLAGIDVTLSQGGVAVVTTATDTAGQVVFGDLLPGAYDLTVESSTLPAGAVLTTTNDPQPVTVTVGEAATAGAVGFEVPADLSVTMTVSDPAPPVDTTITYTVTVTNDGPADASGVEVIDVLPTGVTYVTHTATAGTYVPATGAWSVGQVDAATSATLTIDVSVQGVDSILNVAEVTASDRADRDSVPANADPAEDDYASVSINAEALGTISGRVWSDDNGNGIDDTEPGLENITVTLVAAGADATLGTPDDTTYPPATTNASGAFAFTNLPAETYQVAVDQTTVPAGSILTTANNPMSFSLSEGEVRSDIDFGFEPFTVGSVDIGLGDVTTIAGDGTSGTADGSGTAAQFFQPRRMVEVNGVLYVIDDLTIRAVDLTTTSVTTFAGSGVEGCTSSTDPTAAQFRFARGIAAIGSTLYVLDDCGIRTIDTVTGSVTTLNAAPDWADEYGHSIVAGGDGQLYVDGYNLVYRIDPVTGALTVLHDAGGNNSTAALAADADWVYLVRDSSEIRRISFDGATVETVISDSAVGGNMLLVSGDWIYVDTDSGFLRRYNALDGSYQNIAGTSHAGNTDGVGTDAWFGDLSGATTDGSGALYLADGGNFTIRKVVPGTPLPSTPPTTATTTLELTAGSVTTAYGSGTQDTIDGTGFNAAFNDPTDVSVAGDIMYVAEDNAIRRVDLTTDEVTTLVGSTEGCVLSDDPSEVRLVNLRGIVSDGYYLYAASTYITGEGDCGVTRTSIATGATSQVANIAANDIAMGPDGFLYVSSSGTVHQIDPATGAVTTIGTTSVNGITVDDTSIWGYNVSSQLMQIDIATGTATNHGTFGSTVGLESAGDYLYGVSNPYTIRRWTKSDMSYIDIAGSGTSGYADGTGTDAWFGYISGISVDSGGLWIADSGNDRIRRVVTTDPLPIEQPAAFVHTTTISEGRIGTYAGDGTAALVDSNDPLTASFLFPADGVVHGGFLYVADASAVRKIDIDTGAVSTFAGSTTAGCVDSLNPASAQFQDLKAITTDGHYLYAIDPGCGLRRISIATGAVSTVLINAFDVTANGTDVVVGPDGALYASGRQQVFRIDPTNLTSTLIYDRGRLASLELTADDSYVWIRSRGAIIRHDMAGNQDTIFSSLDYTHTAFLSSGDYLYGTFPSIYSIGRWEKSDGSYVDIAGSGTAGYADGVGAAAQFDNVTGLATSGNGIFYVFDANNRRIRTLEPANPSEDVEFALGWYGYGTWNGGINAGIGNFVTTATDAEVNTVGPGLYVERTYNSRDEEVGPFGPGWTFNYDMRWELDPSGDVVVVYPDGRREVHTDNGDGTFSPPSSYFSTLESDGLAGTPSPARTAPCTRSPPPVNSSRSPTRTAGPCHSPTTPTATSTSRPTTRP